MTEGYLIRARGMMNPHGKVMTSDTHGKPYPKRIISPAANLLYSNIKEAVRARKRFEERDHPWRFEVVRASVTITEVTEEEIEKGLSPSSHKNGWNQYGKKLDGQAWLDTGHP
jgi:hypothetical protein